MKLLYITNGINGSGGLERVLSIKTNYLSDKLGYEVHVLTLNDGATKPFYNFSPSVHFHSISVGGNPVRYAYQYQLGIKKAVKKNNPDIVLVCDDGLKAFFTPFLLGRSRPIIYERHVSKTIEVRYNATAIQRVSAKIKWFLMDVLSKRFQQFIVLTEANKKEWNGTNVKVISNPLTFYPAQNAALTNKKVIAVGKQSYQKGYDRLLQSWKQVVAKHPDWNLEIYGTFDRSQGLENTVEQLGIKNNVRFFEPVQNIEQKYLESSIYVLSSRFEGFGMVLIEAMACGVPCVSFDCPYGPSDIIHDGEDGFLVENGNTTALAEKLEVLVSNENLRREMGAKAKENVQRFLPEPILNQWDELFKNIKN